jgi:hypothetical protein
MIDYTFILSIVAAITGIIGTHYNACYRDRMVKVCAFTIWNFSNILLMIFAMIIQNYPIMLMYIAYFIYTTIGLRTHCDNIKEIPASFKVAFVATKESLHKIKLAIFKLKIMDFNAHV